MFKPDKNPKGQLAKRAEAQLSMLTTMFLLGMAVNLIGLPSENEGTAWLATTIFLVLHGLVGLGLVIGSLLTVKRAVTVGKQLATHAWVGVGVIAATFVAGILTAATESQWWSYGMAVGFIASFWIYGALYFKARK